MIPPTIIEQFQQLVINGKKYTLQKPPIGKGSYGEVFKAFDISEKKIIAIKKQNSAYCQQEIKALQNLQHKNIIKYLGHYIDLKQQKTFIMTQYFQGITLGQKIEKYRLKQGNQNEQISSGLPENNALYIALQLAQGFQYMHKQHYNHCDIKPHNILVNRQGEVKIIDLGLADNSGSKLQLGTLLYCPPEILCPTLNHKFSSKFRDVWSLGLVIYQMLTGRTYFNEFIKTDPPPQRDQIIKKILSLTKQGLKIEYASCYNPFWKDITQKMLKYDYRQRETMKNVRINLNLEYNRKKITHLNPLIKCAYDKISLWDQPNYGNTQPYEIFKSQSKITKGIIYLDFFYKKIRFLKQFQFLFKEKHPFIPNCIKLSLIFLTNCLYISYIKSLLDKLKKNKLRIDYENDVFSEQINFLELAKPDQQKIVAFSEAYIQYFTQEYYKYDSRIHNRLIPFLKPIIEQEKQDLMPFILKKQILTLINDIGEHEVINRQKYIEYIKNCRLQYKDLLKRSKKQLQAFLYTHDAAIIYMVFMFSNFDQIFGTSRVANLDDMSNLYSRICQCRIRKYKNEDQGVRLDFIKQIIKLNKY